MGHHLKLMKFDEVKLNNYLINTGQFALNYIDRVVAEDISSRNNKISETNKNKKLIAIDYSKPLHHNSTRGKEFKWGSTRKIHKLNTNQEEENLLLQPVLQMIQIKLLLLLQMVQKIIVLQQEPLPLPMVLIHLIAVINVNLRNLQLLF